MSETYSDDFSDPYAAPADPTVPQPPPSFEPQEVDEYGYPAIPPPPPGPVPETWDDVPPVPPPPPGFEVIDEYGRPTGHEAYGNPVESDPSIPPPPPPIGDVWGE